MNIKEVLKKEISIYKQWKREEKLGEIDDLYIYDTCVDMFNNLSRGKCVQIMEALIND